MMVFYRLREDKKIAENILYGAVYQNLKGAGTEDQKLENTYQVQATLRFTKQLIKM